MYHNNNKRVLFYALLVWLVLLLFIARPKLLKKNLTLLYSNLVFSSRLVYNSVVYDTNGEYTNSFNMSSHTSLFVLLDSAGFGPNADTESILKWPPELSSVLKDCRDIRLPLMTCRVYLIFYADDAKFASGDIRNRILQSFNKTGQTNNGTPTSGSEKSVEFFVRTIADRKQNARSLRDVMQEAYLSNVDYFYLMQTTRPFDSTRNPGSKSLGEMQTALARTRLLRNVGVVLRTTQNNDVIYSVLVNRIHLEIFGEMFPYEIEQLAVAEWWITAVYPGHLVHYISDANSEVRLLKHSNASSSISISPRDIVERDKVTLERFVTVYKKVLSSNNIIKYY